MGKTQSKETMSPHFKLHDKTNCSRPHSECGTVPQSGPESSTMGILIWKKMTFCYSVREGKGGWSEKFFCISLGLRKSMTDYRLLCTVHFSWAFSLPLSHPCFLADVYA